MFQISIIGLNFVRGAGTYADSRFGLGSQLVIHAVNKMKENACEEVVLETEITNLGAQRLYKRLGFIKDKRLARCVLRRSVGDLLHSQLTDMLGIAIGVHRYYLNGNDAFRLKLWLRDFSKSQT